MWRQPLPSGSQKDSFIAAIVLHGAERRINASRAAMLFAAFAAEAYVNEFVAKHFSANGPDYRAIDRMRTVDKYVVAPRLALSQDLFPRDREPLGSIDRLFQLRDQLVHPKPEKGLPGPSTLVADAVFNPHIAANFVVAVATAADTIIRKGKVASVDPFSFLIIKGADRLVSLARDATRALPAPDAPPLPQYLLLDIAGVTERLRKQRASSEKVSGEGDA